MLEISTLADIVAFESTPLAQRDLPNSTYDVLSRRADKQPDKSLVFPNWIGREDAKKGGLRND